MAKRTKTENIAYIVEQILAVKTLPQEEWRVLLSSLKYTTHEITRGSAWQIQDDVWFGSAVSKRYLIKWKGLSHLHLSWEEDEDLNNADILDVKSANVALDRFNQRCKTGSPLFPDLNDSSEYFPPEYLQIERILDFVRGDEKVEHVACDFVPGVHGTNCSMTVKWRGLSYFCSTFEEVSDIQHVGIEYLGALRRFLVAELKAPARIHSKSYLRNNEEKQKIYFPSVSPVFHFGNILMQHQWAGSCWMAQRWAEGRNCLIMDEPGLGGKTVQAVCALHLIRRMLPAAKGAPFLVIASDQRLDSLGTLHCARTLGRRYYCQCIYI